MKNTIKISSLICLIALTTTVTAKSQAGIYLTTTDYVNKHLSYGTESKIHLNNSVLELPYVTVTGHNKKLKLRKNEIFGYVDDDRKVHRFYKNEEYLIVEDGPITIYTQIPHIAQSKGYVVMKKYYFSKTPESEIMFLNIHNLNNAYRGNEKFIDLLDQYIGGDNATEYDELHNTFKVNYVYTKTLKESSQNLK